jgi:predicted nucleotidyltransferase
VCQLSPRSTRDTPGSWFRPGWCGSGTSNLWASAGWCRKWFVAVAGSGYNGAVEEMVERLADACAGAVGDAMVSVLLHGSLTTGGFRDGDSDIDLLMVVDHPLRPDQAEALIAVVRDADLAPADGIDLHVVAADVAAFPPREPLLSLFIGQYHGAPPEVSRDTVEPDLVTELAMARLGRAVRGAPPDVVIGEIPAEWIRDRGRHWIDVWAGETDDDEDPAYMVLTACRIWYHAVTGRFCAKHDAGAWALQRDSSLSAIAPALRRLHGEATAVIEPAGIAAVLAAARTSLG